MGTRTLTRVIRIGMVGAVALLATSCVIGPITGPGSISLLSHNPSALGYTRSEFFLTGVARSYVPAGPFGTDGKLPVAATGPTATFTTRFVVDRPADPTRFNGTVFVEWLNVSTGVDVPTDLLMAHNEIAREGAVWVGVSAQKVGVDALKATQGARYGSLVHPGDSYSYDIFTQAGDRIRADAARVLGGLVPQRLIADGESQSAGRLVTYIDAIHPLEHAFDGYMVHSRFSGGTRISQSPLPDVSVPSVLPIRADLDVPVMVVEAEGDVIGSELGARQRDTTLFREWELAGTSHADAYTTSIAFVDPGDGSGAVKMLDLLRNPTGGFGCDLPFNAGAHHWLFQAALHGLERWVRTGIAPAVGAPLVVASTNPVVLARDAHGNALGGVRSPQVDAPLATLSSLNGGSSAFCRLFGSTVPFSAAEIAALYPTHADFVAKWNAALYAGILDGFLLPQDAAELAAAAQASTIPN